MHVFIKLVYILIYIFIYVCMYIYRILEEEERAVYIHVCIYVYRLLAQEERAVSWSFSEHFGVRAEALYVGAGQ